MALGAADLDDETLASKEELELIGRLREELKSELAELQAQGLDFPHVVGDVFMTRVVRGNDRDLATCATWYRNFLKLRKEHGLDDIHRRCEAEKIPWRADAMPHAAEMLKHYTVAFDEDKLLTPCGHLLWYDFVGNVSSAILENTDKVKEYIRFMVERRMSVLDRISREQGRLVKIVRIMDTEGIAPWRVERDLLALFRGFIFPLTQSTSIEVLHRLYIINASWFAVKMANFFKSMMAERVQRRLHLLDTHYMEDAAMLAVVPGAVLAELRAKRRSDFDDGSALEGSARLVEAGGAMTRSFQVKEGQKVSWEFCMGSPKESNHSAARSSFAGKLLDKATGEATDVAFTVGFWMDGEQQDDTTSVETVPGVLQQQPLVPSQVVDMKTGKVSGSATAPGAGTICLEWSNKASWVRTKLVSSYKVTIQ